MLHQHFYPEEKKQVKKMPDLVFTGLLKGRDEWMNTLHSHNFCEILFVVSGSGEATIDQKKYPFIKGNIIVYNNGVPHQEEIESEEISLLFFALQNVSIPGMPEGCIVPAGESPVISSAEYDEMMKILLSQMVKNLEEKPDYYQEVTNSMAGIIFLYLLRMYRIPSRVFTGQSVGEEAKRYIEENYTEDIKIDDLAYIFRFSKFYLTHAFKEEVGMPPIKYLTNVRIQEAKKLLGNTEDTINEIALKVGYPDAQCFARVFRNIENMTPTQYRKNIQNYR